MAGGACVPNVLPIGSGVKVGGRVGGRVGGSSRAWYATGISQVAGHTVKEEHSSGRVGWSVVRLQCFIIKATGENMSVMGLGFCPDAEELNWL